MEKWSINHQAEAELKFLKYYEKNMEDNDDE